MTDTPQDPNYQDILDKYAASLNSTETPKIPEPESTSENIHSLESSETPKIEENKQEITADPELLAPVAEEKPTEVISEPEALAPPVPPIELAPESTLPEIPQVPKENNFFKYLFFFSLFIFIIVLVSVIYSFINSQKSLSSSQVTPTIASSPTLAPSTVCQINDQSYQIGETFTATDGCNTCSCNADLTISCTEKTCTATPTAKLSPTKTATSSAKKVPTATPIPTKVTTQ